jgi:hypothetical protein
VVAGSQCNIYNIYILYGLSKMWSFLALCVWMDGKDLVTCSYRTMRSCRDAGGGEKADFIFDESNQISERSNPHSSELCTISQSSRQGRACIQIGLDILPFERSCNVVLMRSSTFLLTSSLRCQPLHYSDLIEIESYMFAMPLAAHLR